MSAQQHRSLVRILALTGSHRMDCRSCERGVDSTSRSTRI